MANPPRTRKRVHAIRRAADGSAFNKCDNCGLLVAMALVDMHECEVETQKNVKRFKGFNEGKKNVVKQGCSGQPRSPFRFFMEDFMETYETGKQADLDREGFETWKNMSMEERQPYVIKAEKVNSVYTKSLIQEMDGFTEVDDEADSAVAGKFNPFNQDYTSHDNFDNSCTLWSRGLESLNTWEWEMVQSWIAESSQ